MMLHLVVLGVVLRITERERVASTGRMIPIERWIRLVTHGFRWEGKDNTSLSATIGRTAGYYHYLSQHNKKTLEQFLGHLLSHRLISSANFFFLLRFCRNQNVFDNSEDYRGPSNAGYFKWMADEETGEMKPVTRMREVNIEKKER